MSKSRLIISIDEDLAEFIRQYARENRTTISEVMTRFILGLKRQTRLNKMEIAPSDPNFHQALMEVRSRLKNGSSQWYTFDDVFGE